MDKISKQIKDLVRTKQVDEKQLKRDSPQSLLIVGSYIEDNKTLTSLQFSGCPAQLCSNLVDLMNENVEFAAVILGAVDAYEAEQEQILMN